jgi:DNA-binding response OmpR family regulator
MIDMSGQIRKSTVLIVDDEPNVRLMFRTALQGAGYETTEAGDGEAALEALGRTPADVVLLDLRMPGMDGMETLRRMRDAGDETPVVIITAHGSIPDAVAAMRLGAIDFLGKPITPERLRAVVADVTTRHGRPAPADHAPAPLGSSGPPVAVTVPIARPAIDLSAAKRALNQRRFDLAEDLLEQALDQDARSAEALTLKGVLHECRGQDHAAFHDYRAALESDPHYGPAEVNLRRYCDRFGIDYRTILTRPRINMY